MAAVHGRTRYTASMRPGRRLVLSLLAGAALAVLPVACATADLPDDDGVKVPDRSEAGDVAAPIVDGAVRDVVQPVVDSSTAEDSSVPQTPRVFVTSSTQNANFGGLAGGDLLCTNLAIAAGLVGKWAAWLSVQTATCM